MDKAGNVSICSGKSIEENYFYLSFEKTKNRVYWQSYSVIQHFPPLSWTLNWQFIWKILSCRQYIIFSETMLLRLVLCLVFFTSEQWCLGQSINSNVQKTEETYNYFADYRTTSNKINFAPDSTSRPAPIYIPHQTYPAKTAAAGPTANDNPAVFTLANRNSASLKPFSRSPTASDPANRSRSTFGQTNRNYAESSRSRAQDGRPLPSSGKLAPSARSSPRSQPRADILGKYTYPSS